MPAVRAEKAGEALGKIAAAVEFLDDFDGVGPERSVGFAVALFVIGLKVIPAMMDDLPER